MSGIVDEAKKLIEEERQRLAQLRHMDKIFGKSAMAPTCKRCSGEGLIPKGPDANHVEWVIYPKCHGTGRPY